MTAHAFGWKRPAQRRHAVTHGPVGADVIFSLPRAVDLRPLCPPVYDQGSLGSCTAQALAAAVEFLRLRQERDGVPVPADVRPSRLALYFRERMAEGTTDRDVGASIGDGVAILSLDGWVPESAWPYDVGRFAEMPPQVASAARLTGYTPLAHDLDVIRWKLALGFPVVFGARVFSQIEEAPGGVITLPASDDAELGGHAMMACGYDDATRVFRVRNSWGESWGDRGNGTIPYDYVRSIVLTDEIYSLEAVL